VDILIKLITIHFLCDFPFQSEYIATKKATDPIVMIAHGCVHAGLSWWVVSTHPMAWAVLGVIFFSHIGIDYIKCAQKINLLQDQILHLSVITALWAVFLRP